MYSFADAIIDERMDIIVSALQENINVNEIDPYGFTPLIEACIVDNIKIAKLLIEAGAFVTQPDILGNTALHWAIENSNLPLCELLNHGADPNAYNLSGQSPLVIPILRSKKELKALLMQQGADLLFAQDYINAKLLGHMFELVGTTNIISPNNKFVEVDFEGFYLEFSLNLLADSIAYFSEHFAMRSLRAYMPLIHTTMAALARSSKLVKFQQYRVDISLYQKTIDNLLSVEPLVIPMGYEGHLMTFVKFGNILVKCDRREDSYLFDKVVFFRIRSMKLFTLSFLKKLFYEKQTREFIDEELMMILGLEPLTELAIPAQKSGNCSWANVEATVPIILFLLFTELKEFNQDIDRLKQMVLDYFYDWRDWNKRRALYFCLQSFYEAKNPLRKAIKAEILAAILYQCIKQNRVLDEDKIQTILAIFNGTEYDYILRHYVEVYSYESVSEEGKNFLRLLRANGYNVR